VFSRAHFRPPALADRALHVIAPSIDPTATKNVPLPKNAVAAILDHTGLAQAPAAGRVPPRFTRRDGKHATVRHRAEVLRYGPPPRFGAQRLVLHVARWDRLKDPVGVLHGFAAHVAVELDAHLLMAGPHPRTVADDPEAEAVFAETARAWRGLPVDQRSRIHLALLPNEDQEENAAIVNALQRAADVVVKKSLEEGFGLGVTEAMWKGRPIVATRVGGIQQQIEHERSGLLIDDPRDLAAFGASVRRLLLDDTTARRLGAAAHRRASAHFLHGRHLAEWLDLATSVLRSEPRDGLEPGARYSARTMSAT
jgi:trehalose synthase